MFLPFLILSITIGLKELNRLASKKIKPKYIHIATGIIITILLFFMLTFSSNNIHKIQEIGICEKEGALYEATKYVEETVPMGQTILSNHWPWFGYHGNHQTLAIYEANVSNIINLSHVKPAKIVYMKYQGLTINPSTLTTDSRIIYDTTFTDSCGYVVEIYDVDKNK